MIVLRSNELLERFFYFPRFTNQILLTQKVSDSMGAESLRDSS